MVRLSEAEWKVMSLLWQEAPQTMMQLTNHFKETTGWTKHTVMTFPAAHGGEGSDPP